MDFILYTLLTTVVVCVIIIIIGRATNTNKATTNTQVQSLSPQQKQWLQKVGTLFSENKALSFLDVYVECGMPKGVAYSKDSDAIKQAFPFNKEETKHDGYDVFRSYQWAIAERYRLQHNELSTIDAAQYGLHLQKGEIIYHRINSVVLHQEKTTRYNIVYSGVRWQSGMLRSGSMSVIGNEITRFMPMDIGRLFITNHRILFIGKQKNVTKSIPIKDVLHYNLYQDGVLVNMPNRKPILFKFEVGYDSAISDVNDGLNEFVIVLNRVISGTENQQI